MKRYNDLSSYYKEKYGSRVGKISFDLGFSCPNIDGTKSFGGCVYCFKRSSFSTSKNIEEQFQEGRKILDKKWPNSKIILYLQAGSNTYTSVSNLKEKVEPLLKKEGVIGLNIATRCDAISDEMYEYLAYLNKRTNLSIELGLQTINESTSKLINRSHTLKEFESAVTKLNLLDIDIIVHVINGLPYETKEDMLNTIKYINGLKIQGIKIHMLYITKNTSLEKLYKNNPFKLLSFEEYTDILVEQIENLKENVIIHRLTGDPLENELVVPLWTLKKVDVLNRVNHLLKVRDSFQGFNLKILNHVKREIRRTINHKSIVVDATIGNGYDSKYLLDIIKSGHLYGFDIQSKAITNTKKLLKGYDNFTLYQENHEFMDKFIKENSVDLIIFNLGYLPGGIKSITTNYSSTIKALEKSLKLIKTTGKILVTVYPGHDAGKLESVKINEFLIKNSINHKIVKNTSNETAPYLIIIQRNR